ncbi:hypothetical protein NE236_20515 [Actinoallomurus purpureus]|uniref:hypothetical protein n=1 Tax=Actinoallomurus purpureus TaxID=478114 RepID=UPI002092518B|nr:hypothetical protein [Actinoallomurus purpureus]MCO6007367.1 hypothetical protein [Actinoallomurus purpureus]
MHVRTTPLPPVDIVKAAAVRLAPLLMRAGLNVTVNSAGVVEARNPCDVRMRQPLVLREHQSALWWHWQWSGPTRDASPEYEPMVPVDDVEEAARRIINVLTVAGS